MTKMNVADAASFFGVSKEAIHNRIRRGSLASEVVDSVKYVVIEDDAQEGSKTTKRVVSKPKPSTQVDSKYYEFLEQQNSSLQQKVEKLEGETRTLRDQKEKMLIDEREKIENIYKEKDEQLKNIINMISSNLMLESKPNPQTTQSVEAEIETLEIDENPSVKENWTPLNKVLKSYKYKKEKRVKILKKFIKKAKQGDLSVYVKNDKCYIDLDRFGYDL